MSAQIEVATETLAQLRHLAELTGESVEDLVAKAIEARFRKVFLEECNQAYSRLRTAAAAWQKELAERNEWESTLGDELEEEE
jgi:hypothetical protein